MKTERDQFYNVLSDAQGFPRSATATEWARLGRKVVPLAYARRADVNGVFYGMEATVPMVLMGEPAPLPNPNLPMILREGPAMPQAAVIQEAPKPSAKPALAALTRSPDLRPTSHLVDPAHGSAALKG